MQLVLKWLLILVAGLLVSGLAVAQQLYSPNKKISLSVMVKDSGSVVYQLSRQGRLILAPGRLGLELVSGSSLLSGFEISEVKYDSLDQFWEPVMGEQRRIRNHYNEMLLVLNQPAHNRVMAVRFRLFDDGLGFRYEFPDQAALKFFTIREERTEFKLADDYQAFWMRGDYDTNEYPYTRSRLSDLTETWTKPPFPVHAQSPVSQPSVQTPLLLTDSGKLYLSIHEAALINYPAMQLVWNQEQKKFETHLTPDVLGNKGYMEAPRHTPWRTVIVCNEARSLVASRLILNLNEPPAFSDYSWVRPMKYMGVWWEYFVTGKSTWAYGKDGSGHGANTKNVKRYIDFAALHGFDAVLVEGWNKGWEDWFGNWKEDVFDFVTPYPDFDVKELQNYARNKNLSLIMHHETSGSAGNYERWLDTAFRFMVENGYRAVKTGYVGKIIPRGEHHDGQMMVNHYLHVAKRAASHQLMVNSHEAVRPTGLHRTFPNWIAQESARGTEFESMGGLPPAHTCILPFTRLLGGPMDYTPGIFQTDLSWYAGNTGRVNTTLVKQLAYYVVLYSPLQMAADLPENYERFPDAFQFIKEVSLDWDTTHVLEAEPGEYVTIARKSKNKNTWFVGGICNEKSRVAHISLSFLPKRKKYLATIYNDGKNASWNNRPQDYTIREIEVDATTKLNEYLAPGGGVAISIRLK